MVLDQCMLRRRMFRATLVRTKGSQMSKILNFERILCPVAESHETAEGLLYAIALARSYRAKLFVLTCGDDLSRFDSSTVDAKRASIKRAVGTLMANTWTKITARYVYAMVRNGKEPQTLDFPRWLQL